MEQSGSEAEIESVVVGLSDAVRLVGMQLSDIDAQWHRIELEFEQRAAWIQQLEAQVGFSLLVLLFEPIVINSWWQ